MFGTLGLLGAAGMFGMFGLVDCWLLYCDSLKGKRRIKLHVRLMILGHRDFLNGQNFLITTWWSMAHRKQVGSWNSVSRYSGKVVDTHHTCRFPTQRLPL